MPTVASNRPSLLVLVRHGQSERNVVKKRNHFYLDDESRKSVKGIPDHLIPLTDEGRRQATVTGAALPELNSPALPRLRAQPFHCAGRGRPQLQ